MSVRDEAEELLDDADLYTDDDRPMATLAEVATAFEVPLHAARSCAASLGLPLVGGTYAMTRERALDLGEELDAIGWALGPADDDDEETDEDLDDEEDEDDELEDEDDGEDDGDDAA